MTDAAPSSDAFLSGQGVPIDLSKVESALADLWGPAAEREGGPDLENPNVTRVALANLVVAHLGGDVPADEGVLDTVVARYPCRAIALRVDPKAGRSVVAEVSALCHLPAPGMPQVCSERIGLSAGPEGFDLLPGAVRPLLESDLPTFLWWAGDPRSALPTFCELARDSNRVLFELPDPGTSPEVVREALDLERHKFGRDLAWFGITKWREVLATFFDPPGREEELGRIASVRIESVTTSAGTPPRVAAWLGGWLAGQLNWSPKSRVQAAPNRVEAVFTGPSGDIAVTLISELDDDASPARISAVSVTTKGGSGAATYHLVRMADEISTEVECPNSRRLPRMVQAPEFGPADRVSAALESARDDPPYRHALPHALWLLDGQASS